jgi:hypothetical protein
MKEATIYISLKEAEELIFNRVLEVPVDRVSVSKARGLLSVALKLNSEYLILHESNYILIFSSVITFEIPEKDKSLFLFHYKLPKGLIHTISRKVRDEKNVIFELEKNDYASDYLLLRNGYVGVYNLMCLNPKNKSLINTVNHFISSFDELSDFQKTVIFEVVDLRKYPLKEIHTDKFVTDRYFRVVWLLTVIKEKILSSRAAEDVSNLDAVKKWMKNLLEFDDFSVVQENILNIPELFEREKHFLLGYYFAIVKFEEFQSEKSSLFEFIEKINYDAKDELLIWITYFHSFFDEEIPYLYFSPLLQDDVCSIEKRVLGLLKIINVDESSYSLFVKTPPNEELLANYIKLTRGLENQLPKTVKLKQFESIIENNLSLKNLSSVGLEIVRAKYFESTHLNTCSIDENYFRLKVLKNISPSDIVFYLEENSVCKDKLKSLKIKIRPLEKLIEKNKKILLGFFNYDEIDYVLELYHSILSKSKEQNIEKLVLVSIVNLESSIVQSIEFDNDYKKYQNQISELFNFKCEFIVRNEKNQDTKEIKRNLKNSIGDYKTSQIEVIDNCLNTHRISWIIDSSTEFWIEKENFNYYSFQND